MPRHKGLREDKLRDYVRTWVAGPRGTKTDFAKQLLHYYPQLKTIERAKSWLSDYLGKVQHANLDAIVAICKITGLEFNAFCGLREPPPADPLIRAIVDECEKTERSALANVLETLKILPKRDASASRFPSLPPAPTEGVQETDQKTGAGGE